MAVALPVQKIKDFYAQPIERPEIGSLTKPQGKRQQNFLLNRWSARLFGKKFLQTIQQLSPLLSRQEAILLTEKLDQLFSFPSEILETLLRRPELTSLILFFEQAFKNQEIDNAKKLLPYLLRWLKGVQEIDKGLIFCKDDPWYRNYFPCKEGTNEEILFNMDDNEFVVWSRAMKAGLEIVKDVWVEAYEEILENIFQVMPIRPDGLNPHNYSIHAFRGIILCAQRPAYMLAQSFVHETGHNKFSTITDIYTLIDNKEEKTFISPFVNKPRTFIPIFHGIFSFLEDLYISKKMLFKVSEVSEGSLERYIKLISGRVEEALGIIKQNAPLTEDGHKLYHSLESMYANYL